jgi:multiple sugar transport system permease protein
MSLLPKYRFKSRLFWALRIIAIIVIICFVILPMFWVAATALKQKIEMFKLPPQWFFKPTLTNFIYVFKTMPVIRWTMNSALISIGTLILSLLLGVPAGYAFSRVKFRGKHILLMFILLTRALPPVVIVLPFRVFMAALGLSGIFESIPVDLEEAAIIDGCLPIGAFFRIALPLSMPGLVTCALFAFIFSWNDFLFALTLTSPTTATLPLGMLSTYGILSVGWTYMAAMGLVAIVPVILLSLLLQKYYVSGLTFGGVK